jgi:hypothetical protein
LSFDRIHYVRIILWLISFALLVIIFTLTYEIVVKHAGPEKENVEIFTKLPIFLTALGMVWALLLLVFGYMTTKLDI